MDKRNITKEINLEMDDPCVDAVVKRLKLELLTLRHIGIKKVKIVHGVGVIADGSTVQNAVRSELFEMARAEKIQAFCPGEQFGPFEAKGKFISELDPSFREDEDWAKSNRNITMVSL